MSEGGLLETIFSTAPLRINDIGGWTDTWFSEVGKVLNLAVSPPVEVEIKVFKNLERIEERVLIHALDFGDIFVVNPDKPSYNIHPFLQGAVNSVPIPMDLRLEIRVHSPLPAGSSTGTSASVCVALLGGLFFIAKKKYSPDNIVPLAHRVETEKLGLQSGIQDQICAAFGGISFIRMQKYPDAQVENLVLDAEVMNKLNKQLSLIYMGKSHSSSALHEKVINSLKKGGSQAMQIPKLRKLAEEARKYLLAGDLSAYGEVMIRNNDCQRTLHSGLISRAADSVIKIAEKYKASGWKVNGAGGEGGSLTILSSPGNTRRALMHKEIESLKKGIRSFPIFLSDQGLIVSYRSAK